MFLSKEDCHRLLSWKSGMERESKLSQNSFWCILYTAKHIFCAHISCVHILDFTYFCAHTSVHLFLCTRSTYMQEQKNIRVQYPLTTLFSSSMESPSRRDMRASAPLLSPWLARRPGGLGAPGAVQASDLPVVTGKWENV